MGAREYQEIDAWLTGEHGASQRWAQKLIVDYEQARGLPGAWRRPDGIFTAGASKTGAALTTRRANRTSRAAHTHDDALSRNGTTESRARSLARRTASAHPGSTPQGP
jgi:hypothetical protein